MTTPSIRGRVLIEKNGEVYRASMNLEVFNGVFVTPYGEIIDATSAPRALSYAVNLAPGRYYPPVHSPLPRPRDAYSLVDAALVYTHDPVIEVVQGNESMLVLTRDAYTIVEGLVYSHLGLRFKGKLDIPDELLVAYPVMPNGSTLREYVTREYEMLKRGYGDAHLRAAILACSGRDKCVLEEAWRRGRAYARLSLIQREWASMLGCTLSSPSPVELRVAGSGVIEARARGDGVVRLVASCGGETLALEFCVRGLTTRRIGEECVVERYSTLCPYCLY